MRVTVLMSTYNGEKYLQDQLDSIFFQKKVEVRLIVRDDGSSDKTMEILEDNAHRHSNMIILKGERNLGPCKSFLSLIRSYCDSDYFALADQDDIWDKNKLSIAIDKLETLPKDKPVLYYSNLRIVDENNRFLRNSHTKPLVSNHKHASLIENLATGCTIVYNQKLAEIAFEKQPEDFSMHDAWLYMVCVFLGNLVYDFEAHINYRLHGKNEIGTYGKRVNLKKIKSELNLLFDWKSHLRLKNAEIFAEEFANELEERDFEKIKSVCDYKRNISNRLKILWDSDIKSDSRYRNIKLFLQIILGTL